MKIASWVKHYLLPVAILAASVVRIYHSADLVGSVSTLFLSTWTLPASTTKQPLVPTILSSPDSLGVCKENAVIYMAQKKHSSYNRDSHGLLTKSITLLFDNYLNQHHYNNTNVFIFHTGDFNIDDLKQMEAPLSTKGLLHLVDLSNTTFWEIPEWLRGEDPQTWGAMAEFSVGYRHMLNSQHGCSYRFIMRLDEESFIHSRITYNLFEKMQNNSYVYGFRNCAFELGKAETLWTEYAPNRSITPQRTFVKTWLCGFYNNFFIADLNFFLSPRVQDWLRFADKSGKIYRERLNDLVLQTVAVYAFANKLQIHRFLDFTYEHFSRDNDGCPKIGALAEGYDDPQATAFENQLREEEKVWRAHRCRTRRKIVVLDLTQSRLSPSYHHLPPHLLNLTLRVVRLAELIILAPKLEILVELVKYHNL